MILALACASMVLAGCCDILNPTTCDPPYMKSGGACCLDENYNFMCDSEEYVCGDGSVVTDENDCPEPVFCDDGSVVYDIGDCPPAQLGPGHFSCNERTEPPCDFFKEAYCPKFTPTDLEVRVAAAEAIAEHPGAYSLNQLFDIYDWMNSKVFYQNVPLDMSEPYYPNETLRTRSGDCKNQAVLLASMVEAIGGRANVRLVPECHHAFPVVYIGNDTDSLNATFRAIRAHYKDAADATLHYRYWTEGGQTLYWLIFDTAGAHYPGTTLDDCLNASQTFEVYDCNYTGTLNAPQISGTEYGPWGIIDDTRIIQAGWSNYQEILGERVKDYAWCRYNVSIQSLSGPIDWFVTDYKGYVDYRADNAFSYYCGGKWVQNGVCELSRDTTDSIYILIHNPNARSQATVERKVTVTCYAE